MTAESNVSYIVAFGTGLMVFLSPCILPLIPSYLAYLTGVSFREISETGAAENSKRIRLLTAAHSLFFILGFTLIFVALGATATFLGKLLGPYQALMKKIGGLLIIFFGLYILGIIKLDFLQKEKHFTYKKSGASFAGSFLVGATFAAAWTPCVGPILASILAYAASTADPARGAGLLTAFSLGVAVPFFLSSVLINSFVAYFKKIQKYLKVINTVGGVVLVVFGALLLTGNFDWFSGFLMRVFYNE